VSVFSERFITSLLMSNEVPCAYNFQQRCILLRTSVLTNQTPSFIFGITLYDIKQPKHWFKMHNIIVLNTAKASELLFIYAVFKQYHVIIPEIKIFVWAFEQSKPSFRFEAFLHHEWNDHFLLIFCVFCFWNKDK